MPFMLVLLVIFLFVVAYLIHERLKYFQLFRRLGIPGPPPSLIDGNMRQLMGKGKLVVQVMAEWESKYGPIYGYFRGTRATLVVCDPELIKDILIRNSGSFINRPHMVMNVPPIPDTVVGLRGQRWKEVRQILSPTFSGAKIKQMFPIMENCVQTTVNILQEKFHKGKTDKERITDSHQLFQALSCDVICACALAMKVNAQMDDSDRFYTAVRGFLDNALGPFVKTALCFPLLAQVASWALVTFGYSHEMTKMIMASVQQAISLRRNPKQNGGCGGDNGEKIIDFLQLMMEAKLPDLNGNGHWQNPEKTTESLHQPALTDDEIIANAWVFILGGFETTSSSLSYTCHMLSIHQGIQEKLFIELKGAFGIDESPTYEKISEMIFLDQIVCESLRLFPPVVNFVVRGLERDSWIGPYHLPGTVGIQVPVWQIHHDPQIWPEPYSFNPDRFANNAKKSFATNMQWIPFGGGPRSCVGARFAVLNMKFTLSSILRKFKIVAASSVPYKLKLKVPSVTIVPDGGLPLRFIPRDI